MTRRPGSGLLVGLPHALWMNAMTPDLETAREVLRRLIEGTLDDSPLRWNEVGWYVYHLENAGLVRGFEPMDFIGLPKPVSAAVTDRGRRLLEVSVQDRDAWAAAQVVARAADPRAPYPQKAAVRCLLGE